jgi:hypothetical protein
MYPSKILVGPPALGHLVVVAWVVGAQDSAPKIQAEWDYYVDGKPAGKHRFDLVRKK